MGHSIPENNISKTLIPFIQSLSSILDRVGSSNEWTWKRHRKRDHRDDGENYWTLSKRYVVVGYLDDLHSRKKHGVPET